MAETALHPQREGWLRELRAAFEDLRPQYSTGLIHGGYSILEGKPKLVQAVMFPWKGVRLPIPATREYPKFVLFRSRLSVDQVWDCFEGLVRTGALKLPGKEPYSFGGELHEPSKHPSAIYPFYSEWPFTLARIEAMNDSRTIHQKLSSPNAELYPGPQDALHEWTGVTTGYANFSPVVYALLPDFRARITSVDVGSRGVRVGVKIGLPAASPLSLRYYASSDGQAPVHGAILPKRGLANCEVGYAPDRFLVDLYGGRVTEPLDWRDFDARRPTFQANDIRFTLPAEQLRNTIRGGESLYVEFKAKLPTPELAESVCAFANSKGGTIFVGVDKNTEIVGFSSDRFGVEHIDDVIRSGVDPTPDYVVRRAKVDRKPLILIQVPEGASKPYCLKDRGIYVRANGSDRAANRVESLELCGPKQ